MSNAETASTAAAVAERGAHVAPAKSPSKKSATQKKGAPKGRKTAKRAKATAWQARSVRGFISSAAKKHNIKIESSKNEAGDRVYKSAK